MVAEADGGALSSLDAPALAEAFPEASEPAAITSKPVNAAKAPAEAEALAAAEESLLDAQLAVTTEAAAESIVEPALEPSAAATPAEPAAQPQRPPEPEAAAQPETVPDTQAAVATEAPGASASAALAPPAAPGGGGPSAETLTYVGLGSAALSFLATFFVAPRFKESFKEPVDWKEMYAALVARGVKTVTPEEAYARARKGSAVLLDVRLADKHSERAPEPSVSAPLYQPIAGWDLASNVRRVGFAFFGIFGTELNPDFLEEALAKVPKNKEVLVICESGGTIENKPGTQFGFQSRSLKAVYFLQQAGYSRVLHVKGGLGEWQRAGLPLTASASDGGSSDKQEQQEPKQQTAKGTTGGRGATVGGAKAAATAKELVSLSSRGGRK